VANGGKLRLTKVKTPLMLAHHVNLITATIRSHRIQIPAPVGIMIEVAILHGASTNSVHNLERDEGYTNSVG
jgi:hypothetical protein